MEYTLVNNNQREKFLPALFNGNALAGVKFEHAIYNVMDRTTDEYNGGMWEFAVTSTNAMMMFLDSDKKVTVTRLAGYCDVTMTLKALSMAVFSFVLNQMIWKAHEDGNETLQQTLTQNFYGLQDALAEHPESTQIFQFLD